VGHVACKGEERWWGSLKESDLSENLDVDGKIMLK